MPCKSISSLKWLAVVILSVGFLPGLAQNQTIDSLKTLLGNPDADRVKTLIELAMQNNMAENYNAALAFASEAVPLAITKGDSLQIVMAYRFKGAALRRMERLDEALEIITNANAIAQRNNFISEMKFLMNSMAMIYNNKAQYDRALDYNFQSLVIREEQGDQSEISISMNNIGTIYLRLNNHSRALDYLNKSLKIKQDINDDYDLDKLLINIGLSEMYLGNFEKAANNLKKAFEVCGNQCSNEIIIGGEFGLGEIDYHLQKEEESFKHFTASYNLAKRSGNQRFQSENLIMLGKIAMKSGNLSKAEKLLNDAKEIANKVGYTQLMIDTYKELFNLYSLQKNSKKEILYLKKYVYLSDSLISLDLVKNIATIQSRFDERENLKNIKTLEENIVLKNEAIARQQLLNMVLGSAAVLLVIIGILIYWLYALRNKSNKQLDDKVRQRTQQLQEGQTHLQGVLYEQKLFMENMRDEMRAMMATLKGTAFDQQQVIYHSTVAKLNVLIERIDQKSTASTWSKIALSFAFVFFMHTSVFSQKINKVRFDSIKAHLPGKTFKDRHYLMHAMAYELFDVDNPKAKLYADTAWLMAKQLADSFEITKTGRLRGQLLRRTERLNEAIAQFQQVLPIAQRHHFLKEEKYALNALGIAYNFKGVYDSALDVTFHSLQIREEEGDKLEIALALNNIGLIYYKIHDYEHAVLFYQKARKVQDEIHEMQGMERILINLSLCYIHLKEYEKANELANKAFSLCKSTCSDEIFISIEQCWGFYYFHLKKYKEAATHINLAYARTKITGDIRAQAEHLLTLGEVAAAKGDYEHASSKLEEAMYLSKHFGYNQVLSNVYFEFSRLYNKTSDFKKAAYFQNKYINLNDSIYNPRMIKNLAQVQITYAERENLKLIKAQNENLALKENAIHQQEILNFTLLAITCLITIIGILIYRLYMLRSKTNRQLDIKVKQRTQQLEEGQTHLQGVLQEQHLFIENIREEMKALTATLKGWSLMETQGITLEKESKAMTMAGATNKLDAIISRIDGKRNLTQELK